MGRRVIRPLAGLLWGLSSLDVNKYAEIVVLRTAE
jgi:hypothetical protein